MMLTKNIRHIVGILSVLIASVLLYGCAQTGVNDAPSSNTTKHSALTSGYSITIDNETSSQIDGVKIYFGANNYEFYAFVGYTGQYSYSLPESINYVTIQGTRVSSTGVTAITLSDGRTVYATQNGNIIVVTDTTEMN
jgi:hypothetical protein